MIIKTVKDKRGVALMMTVFFLVFLLLLIGIASDFMRAYVAKREVQDALDAATLSAAQVSSEQYRTTFVYKVEDYNCYPDDCGGEDCYCEDPRADCEPDLPVGTNGETAYSGTSYSFDICGGSSNRGLCVTYLGEWERWIDYTKGMPAQQVAEDIWQYNVDNSRLASRDLSNTDAEFYVANSRTDPEYPSVSGWITTSVPTVILTHFIGPEISFTCRSQSMTTYMVYEGGYQVGLNPIPADHWNEPGYENRERGRGDAGGSPGCEPV